MDKYIFKHWKELSMKAIYFWISDELHKTWRAKLSQMGTTGKNVLISFVESFVKVEKQDGKKRKEENR